MLNFRGAWPGPAELGPRETSNAGFLVETGTVPLASVVIPGITVAVVILVDHVHFLTAVAVVVVDGDDVCAAVLADRDPSLLVAGCAAVDHAVVVARLVARAVLRAEAAAHQDPGVVVAVIRRVVNRIVRRDR